MTREFTGYITALAEQQDATTKKLDRLSNDTNDPVLLQRLQLAFHVSDDLRGVLAILAARSRAILAEEERQKDLILKQYQASIDAREVTK